MKVAQNLKIGTRLGLGFGFVVLLMLAMVACAEIGLNRIGGAIDLITKDRYVKIQLGAELLEAVNVQSRKVRNVMLHETDAERTEELDSIAKLRATSTKAYTRLDQALTDEVGRKTLASLQQQGASYDQALTAFDAAARAGDLPQARKLLMGTLRPRQLEYLKQLKALVVAQEALMQDAVQDAAVLETNVGRMLLVLALVGGLLAALAAWLVTRSVTQPVAEAVAALQRLEAGDLTLAPTTSRGDELGAMLHAVARTTTALRTVVGQVRDGVQSVTVASSEIAAGNHDLSGRTEQQASALQQTAASMEQFSGSLRQSADNARQANALANAARAAAGRGGDVVGQVVSTMDDISASSQRIGDIIGVIDGIAFQTNILALNAAVEAARAGEHGRGFAVVASEVRGLAQRSSEAAREIKALIGTSVERVQTGSRQVADAGAAMHDIVTQVQRVTDLVAEISSASIEQSAGVGQVTQAVSQMDQATQQNAALVEQAAAAAQSLDIQARQLAKAVAVFRLSATAAAA